MAIERKSLEKYLNQLLDIYSYNDYGTNGLQIEGKDKINKIAFSVSCSREAIDEAIKQNADCLIAHHGLIWNHMSGKTLRGPYARRIFPLIRNEINLFGYHLPLDAHMEVGNAACIAEQLGLVECEPFCNYKGTPIGVKGRFTQKVQAKILQEKLAKILNHQVIISSPDENESLETLGILTGGASSSWYHAVKDKLDGYLTGEISEHDWHDAREAGIHMFAGGHYATEQFGVLALMEKIKEEFKNEKPECFFIPSDNPV